MSVTREVVNGLETSETKSVGTSFGISLPIPSSFGVNLKSEIKSTVSNFKQETWKQTQTEYFVVPAGRKYEWKRAVVSYDSEFGENSLRFYSKAKFLCVDDSCE